MAKPSPTPATCDTCGLVVSRESDLPRHQLTHAPNRKELTHPCPYACGYSALQKSNLKNHLNIHTGERPHKCPDCPFDAKDPSNLSRHRQRKHGYQPKKRTTWSPATDRNGRRQQRRYSPYSPSSERNDSVPLSGQGAPFSSLPLASDHVEGGKNHTPTYSTELITGPPRVDTVSNAPNSSLPNIPLESELLSVSVAPALGYPQLQEQGAPHATIQPGCDITFTQEEFDNFFSKLSDWPLASPSLPASLLPYGVDNISTSPPTPATLPRDAPIPAPAAPLPYHNQCTADSAFMPIPIAVPSYGVQYPADNTPYEYHGYTTQVASHAQFSQPLSFPTPNLGTYWIPQGANHQAASIYYTYAPTDGFAAPEFYMH